MTTLSNFQKDFKQVSLYIYLLTGQSYENKNVFIFIIIITKLAMVNKWKLQPLEMPNFGFIPLPIYPQETKLRTCSEM